MSIYCDLERDRLPFPDNYFDLVTSFGVIEHLKYYDNIVKEAYRVLKKGGVFFISTPNLGNMLNRVLLLMGYQPRDVEISKVKAFGLPEVWPLNRRDAYGHIHAPTLRALKEILEYYGFAVTHVWGVTPKDELKLQLANTNVPLKYVLLFLNNIFSLRASLSARIFLLGLKRYERPETLNHYSHL